MKEVSIIGGDLAKQFFQLHGATGEGEVVFRKKQSRRRVSRLHADASKMHGGDGGMCDWPLLGAYTD